ncbi:hypothetical protein F5050DRAFT_1806002 [Lentinula boryana]|uniref:Uncharacterized protein n=1 Tax=Lentinula boryana TaxID=40481 RepID=A0ABQ8QJ08_9AGAR|nr:hypothetical protein F5050DRAFT_1806002 [Lentinula boryana]
MALSQPTSHPQIHNAPGSAHLMGHYTAQFTALIDEERGRIALFYQEKLAEVESRLNVALDEAAFLRATVSKMAFSQEKLQQKLDMVKHESATCADVIVWTRRVATMLVSYFRKRAAKLESMQEESQRQLAETLYDKQVIQIELDASRARHIFQLQALELDRKGVKSAKESETDTLNITVAQLQESLSETRAEEVSAKRYAYLLREQKMTLESEISSIKENSRMEQRRLSEEMMKLRHDLTTRLEAAIHDASNYESKAKEATERSDLLSRQLDCERRESSIALRHQADASHQKAAQVEDQLSSLATQHSKAETALIEARNSLTNVQTHAEQQMEDFRRQLSSVQENSRLEQTHLEKRISSLFAVLCHHEIAFYDSDLDVLKPAPRLVSIWETIQELIPVSEDPNISALICFPKFLTEDTFAVIPAIYNLIDRLRSRLNDVHGLQRALAERDHQIESLRDGLEVNKMAEASSIILSPLSSLSSLSDSTDDTPLVSGKTVTPEADMPPGSQSLLLSSGLTVVNLERLALASFVPSSNTPNPKSAAPIFSVETSFDLGETSAALPSPEMTPSKPDVLEVSNPPRTEITSARKRRRGRLLKKNFQSAMKAPLPGSSNNGSTSHSIISLHAVDLLPEVHWTKSVTKRVREAQEDSSKGSSNKRFRNSVKASASASTSASTTHTPTVQKFAFVEIVVSKKQHPSQNLTRSVCPSPSATQSFSETTESKYPLRQ